MMFAVDLTWVVEIIYIGSQVIITSHGTLFDVGQRLAIFTYGFQILMSLMQLSMIFVMVTMADESARRISEVLEAEPTICAPEQAVTEVADGSIDFDHVSFKYSARAERQALADVDLHVRSGETIGIIGGTGSSKSTLVNLVARLYDATEGRVRVGGVDVRDYDLEALRTNVAMVLQKNVLFSGTIAENLRWGDENATDDEVREAAHHCLRRRVRRWLPRGLRHLHRAGRLQRLRRAEAAPMHRPSPAAPPGGPHPRRLHERRGHQDRRQDPRRPGDVPSQRHVHHYVRRGLGGRFDFHAADRR